MPKVTLSDGAVLHYEQIGEGPDLVLIHGIGGNLATWHFKIVPSLWDRFRTLTYDIRGHGYSSMTETGYTPTDMARDLKELMDHVGVEKADVVGHSYGADVALYFAFLYPERVRRLVVIEATVPALVPILTRARLQKADWAASVLERMGIPIVEERRYDTEYMLREAFKLPNKWGPLKDMPAQWTTDRMIKLYGDTTILKDAVEVGDLTQDKIKTIEAPTHLVYDSGSVGWRRSYRFLQRNLPHVTSVMVRTRKNEFAHFSPLEKPDIVVKEILAGLEEKSDAGAQV
jgi:pimeloyl-ACP methyl ester carboxylesterase